MDTQEIRRIINWLEREEIVILLENYGFACYDTESTDSLREALFLNVEDETIPSWELYL
jgi:hypothetical protein